PVPGATSATLPSTFHRADAPDPRCTQPARSWPSNRLTASGGGSADDAAAGNDWPAGIPTNTGPTRTISHLRCTVLDASCTVVFSSAQSFGGASTIPSILMAGGRP